MTQIKSSPETVLPGAQLFPSCSETGNSFSACRAEQEPLTESSCFLTISFPDSDSNSDNNTDSDCNSDSDSDNSTDSDCNSDNVSETSRQILVVIIGVKENTTNC